MSPDELKEVAVSVVERAMRAGADGVEVFIREGNEFEGSVRQGAIEVLKDAGYRSVSLRYLKDGRAVATGASDLSASSLDRLVGETAALVLLADPDVDNCLPAAEQMAREVVDLDLYDSEMEIARFPVEERIEAARDAERAALSYDPRITASGGATYATVEDASAFASSRGFAGSTRGTFATLAVEVVADDSDGKKRNGSWYARGRFRKALAAPADIGVIAAKRALDRLGARKVKTGRVPVVFDRLAATALLRDFAGLVTGTAWYKKRSFLAGALEKVVASPLVTIIDDPLLRRGPGSRSYDGEGLSARRNVIVEKGVLRTVLTSTYSARKTGLPSSASAGGGGATPSEGPSNLFLSPGSMTPDEIVAGVSRGLLVTDLMGFGFNPVTGDFSRGCSGFWIEDGVRAFPVAEITISAAFADILGGIVSIGSDLVRESSIVSPTVMVDSMMVAGST